MPKELDEFRYLVALANRMVANEGVLDAFGHVSARHPTDPGRYLLSRSRSPQLVEPGDILEYNLDSEPVRPPSASQYAERVIHGEIYKARPDVMAVCHHHGKAIMPFCITRAKLVPVFHLGAAIGDEVPFWDQRDEFGDTNLLVVKPEEGASLARTLGPHAAVLMDRHGATVVGGDLRQLVARTIFMCQNAEYQLQAHGLGRIGPLSIGEIRIAGGISALPNVVGRTWEYWSARLDKAGGLPPQKGRQPAEARTPAAKARKQPKVKAKSRR